MKTWPVVAFASVALLLIGCLDGDDRTESDIGSVELDKGSADSAVTATLPDLVIDWVVLGPVRVNLGETTLPDLQAQLGGTITRQGDAGTALASLCYTTSDAAKVIIGSSSLGGSQHAVTQAELNAEPSEHGESCRGIDVEAGSIRFEHGLRLGMRRDAFTQALPGEVDDSAGVLRFEWRGDYFGTGSSLRIHYFAGVEGTVADSEVRKIRIWLTETT